MGKAHWQLVKGRRIIPWRHVSVKQRGRRCNADKLGYSVVAPCRNWRNR